MHLNASNLGKISALFGLFYLGDLNDIERRNNGQKTLCKKVRFSKFNGRFSHLTS
jgi:hypothetical protein